MRKKSIEELANGLKRALRAPSLNLRMYRHSASVEAVIVAANELMTALSESDRCISNVREAFVPEDGGWCYDLEAAPKDRNILISATGFESDGPHVVKALWAVDVYPEPSWIEVGTGRRIRKAYAWRLNPQPIEAAPPQENTSSVLEADRG